MFDIGWSEMAVIALIALLVIGPKELPNAMRAAAKWARKARSLAREFQSGIDDMIREAELEDARKAIGDARSGNLDRTIEDTIDPEGEVRKEARDLDRTARQQGDSKDGTSAPSKKSDTSEQKQPETAEADGGNTISHPARVAPPHSLPPKEDQAAPPAGQGGETSGASSGPGEEPAEPGQTRP